MNSFENCQSLTESLEWRELSLCSSVNVFHVTWSCTPCDTDWSLIPTQDANRSMCVRSKQTLGVSHKKTVQLIDSRNLPKNGAFEGGRREECWPAMSQGETDTFGHWTPNHVTGSSSGGRRSKSQPFGPGTLYEKQREGDDGVLTRWEQEMSFPLQKILRKIRRFPLKSK